MVFNIGGGEMEAWVLFVVAGGLGFVAGFTVSRCIGVRSREMVEKEMNASWRRYAKEKGWRDVDS